MPLFIPFRFIQTLKALPLLQSGLAVGQMWTVNQRKATSCFTAIFSSHLVKIGEFSYLVYFLYDLTMKLFLLLTG